MNNNIKINSKNYINRTNNTFNNVALTQQQKEVNETFEEIKDVASSVNFLGAMGHAQVNFTNQNMRTRAYLEKFQKDEFLSSLYVEFSDSLIQSGLTTKQAIKISDIVFKELKKGELYQ